MTDARPERDPRYRSGPKLIAWIAAASTVPLLFTGGQVTSYRVGMAVPDWPTTFGINMLVYNMWNASWGVFIEHRHRLFGMAVGIESIVLAIWFLAADRRIWVKILGVNALLVVGAQGLLGGNRVLLNSSTLAMIHGISAQAIFGMFVALVVLTGRDWLESNPRGRDDPDHLRRRALVTLFLIYSQIVLGALLRHFQWGLVVHATMALAVWGHAAMLFVRVERRKNTVAELVPSARAMAIAVTLQVALGIVAWWLLRPFDGLPKAVTLGQALVRTGHLVNGALLLGSTVVLTLRSFRHLRAPKRSNLTEPVRLMELVA